MRGRAEATREALGESVDALAAKTDVEIRARKMTAAVKEQFPRRPHRLVRAQLGDKATHAARAVQDRTPEPVRAKAAATTEQVGDKAVLARRLIALLPIRRSRRHR